MTVEVERYELATKPNVWLAAQNYLIKTGKVPSTAQIRPYFATPQSPAIAVYFQEWKVANESMIRLHRGGKEAWKTHALKLEEELKSAYFNLSELDHELTTLKDWLAEHHIDVITAWEYLNRKEDEALCKTA